MCPINETPFQTLKAKSLNEKGKAAEFSEAEIVLKTGK